MSPNNYVCTLEQYLIQTIMIVTTIGKGNGSGLVLLDLSAAFDTIDHGNLFNHFEKYVGISGNALKLFKSYFSGRTPRVMIDGILSDVASLICSVPQGSVLESLEFCLYLLPLAAILRYHNDDRLAIMSTLMTHNSTFLLKTKTHLVLWQG